MNQSTTFLLIMTGLVLLFTIMGIIPLDVTLSSSLVNLLLDPQSIATSKFFINLILATGAALATTITLGFIFKNLDYVVRIPIALYLISLLWDFSYVYTIMMAQGTLFSILALLFFSPLMLMWVLVMIDYIPGRD